MTRRLIVGSWPGSGYEYIRRFCDSLALAEVTVKDVKKPLNCIFEKMDVLHIHWPEQVFWETKRIGGIAKAITALAALIILKCRGVTLVWCVHNLEPHDAKSHLLLFWRFYSEAIAFLVNGFVTLSPSTLELVRSRFSGLSGKPATFIWHPNYLIDPDSNLGSEWRKRHRIDPTSTVLAFIGAVRPYKGIEELVSAFKETTDRNLRLVIAGRASDQQLRSLLQSAAKGDERIFIDLNWLSDTAFMETALASNLIVLPFRQMLHSGSILYGLSCAKTIITPATAFANDLRNEVGSQWIKTYEPPLSGSELETLCKCANGKPNLNFSSINISGIKLKEFYIMLHGPLYD